MFTQAQMRTERGWSVWAVNPGRTQGCPGCPTVRTKVLEGAGGGGPQVWALGKRKAGGI